MKKLILAITVFVFTGAFEQRAAVVLKQQSPVTAETLISRLDTLSDKVNRLNVVHAKILTDEK